jgi:hypothetical protein
MQIPIRLVRNIMVRRCMIFPCISYQIAKLLCPSY